MGLLTWILVGLVAGLIAQFLIGGGFGGLGLRGLAITTLLGVGGALLGGFISAQMGYGDVSGFDVRTLVIATLGAIVVIIVFQKVSSGRGKRGLI